MIGSEETARLVSTPKEPESSASPFMRAFVVARSRYAEDQLAHAVERGAKQFVILGAGLDTFAYRNPSDDLRVFEVDHPATRFGNDSGLQRQGSPYLTAQPLCRWTLRGRA